MIVFRVMTSADVLAGKTGEFLGSLRMADNRAQELANESGREVTVTSYNTVTRGFDFIKAYYPDPAIAAAKRRDEDRARQKKRSEEIFKRMQEGIRAEQEARKYYEQARTRFEQRKTNTTVKTKLTVAMSNLGLSDDFDQPMLKSQYRKMAMKYHPDRPGGSAKNFDYIQKSYEYLLSLKGWK
jgi:hypothetical protein